MFLFSGRSYRQELIEFIVWTHNKLKIAPATQRKALSIVQGLIVIDFKLEKKNILQSTFCHSTSYI